MERRGKLEGAGYLVVRIFPARYNAGQTKQCSLLAELWSRENTENFWICAVVSKPYRHRGIYCMANDFCHCQAPSAKETKLWNQWCWGRCQGYPCTPREVQSGVGWWPEKQPTTSLGLKEAAATFHVLCLLRLVKAAVLFHSKVGHTGLMHSFVIWSSCNCSTACSPEHNLGWRKNELIFSTVCPLQLPSFTSHRITERFRLEGSLKIIQFQHPAKDTSHYPRSLRVPSNLVLNTARDEESTDFLGNLCQCLSSIAVKNLFSMPLSLPSFNVTNTGETLANFVRFSFK